MLPYPLVKLSPNKCRDPKHCAEVVQSKVTVILGGARLKAERCVLNAPGPAAATHLMILVH